MLYHMNIRARLWNSVDYNVDGIKAWWHSCNLSTVSKDARER
jgi:hypothetical protein